MDNLQLLDYWVGRVKTSNITNSKKYYKGENVRINNRKMEFVADGMVYEDVYKANEKIAKNDYRTIVDQLTGYLIGSQPTIENVPDDVYEVIDKKNLWNVAKKALKNAQIQSRAWVQPYIRDDKLKYVIHKNSENIIPIYKDDLEDELEKVIYFYKSTAIVGKEVKEVRQAEVWDSETVTYYNDVNGKWDIIDHNLLTNDLTINPMPHIIKYVTYENGESRITETNTWGRVPFIELKFNEEGQTALEMIGKNKIDALDYLLSDGCNNFMDLADAIYILENYQGDVSEALINLKSKKAVAVGEGGGVSQLSNEIPMVSREKMIDIIKNAIYSDGQAVNIEAMRGGSLTNVVIKAWFTALDLKADNVIPNLEEFYIKLLEFAYLFKRNFEKTDYIQPSIVFNKTMIMNEIEYIEKSNESVGNISNYTRLANDPRVNDVEKELERITSEEVSTYAEIE